MPLETSVLIVSEFTGTMLLRSRISKVKPICISTTFREFLVNFGRECFEFEVLILDV